MNIRRLRYVCGCSSAMSPSFKEVIKALKQECVLGKVTTKREALDFVSWKVIEYADAAE